jgi:hypothetical protein
VGLAGVLNHVNAATGRQTVQEVDIRRLPIQVHSNHSMRTGCHSIGDFFRIQQQSIWMHIGEPRFVASRLDCDCGEWRSQRSGDYFIDAASRLCSAKGKLKRRRAAGYADGASGAHRYRKLRFERLKFRP